MNAGALQLAALGLSLGEIIERLKAAGFTGHPPTISRWRSGKMLPGSPARKAIEQSLGIKRGAWDDPEGSIPPVEGVSAQDPATSAPIAAKAPTLALDPPAAELAKDLLGRIQALREQSELTTLPLSARKALAEMEGKAIERYAKLSGQAATERDILSSPHFTRVLDDMFRVLEEYPDALKALRRAMSEDDAA